MRILIVEDEKLTREGIRGGVNWEKLGIDEVDTAADGLSGLSAAMEVPPDILLTDVRMPHLDGLTMAEQIQQSIPGLVIVIMSGYQDREYLKEAIRLKAVSFVEKPIDLLQLQESLREAVKSAGEEKKREAFTTYSQQQEEARLALSLTQPAPFAQEELALWLTKCQGRPGTCLTVLISCYDSTISTEEREARIVSCVRSAAERGGFDLITGSRQNSLQICHLFGRYPLLEKSIADLAENLRTALASRRLRFHVVVGRQVETVGQLHLSYETAAAGLQKVFFQEENTCYICGREEDSGKFHTLSDLTVEEDYRSALGTQETERVMEIVDALPETLLGRTQILPGQVKDLYYRLLSVLRRHCVRMQIENSVLAPHTNLMDLVSSAVSLYSLHRILKEATLCALKPAADHGRQAGTVGMIEYYVASNYSSRELSVKAISEYVHLSTAYVCTLYKAETGHTLNQFITEYRMQKARELLSDPRNRVSEIAESVGFTDGNYFAKAFKKQFGLSPSEYRGRMSMK